MRGMFLNAVWYYDREKRDFWSVQSLIRIVYILWALALRSRTYCRSSLIACSELLIAVYLPGHVIINTWVLH